MLTLATLQFVSQNGVVSIIYRYLTLNPATGYFRTLIWQYAGAEAWRHPWFGIGYEEYLRPSWMVAGSIDAHYLAMATRYGLLSASIYFLIAVIIIVTLSRRASDAMTTASRQGYLALAICLTVIVILLFTVTFWGAMLSWFNLLLGLSASIAAWPKNRHYGMIENRG